MDTWGISGPDFLLIYAGLAGTVLVVALVLRWAVTSGDWYAAEREPQPIQLAYLNGDAQLALYSALAALRAAEAIDAASSGQLIAIGPIPTGANQLEQAVYDAAQRNVSVGSLRLEPRVSDALASIAVEVERAGWLLTPSQRARIRLGGVVMLLVAALGAARIFAGIANDRPVGFLVLMAVPALIISFILLATVPRQTRAGKAVLAREKHGHAHLSPTQSPAWATYGMGGAAMGVALFGAAAFYAGDAAFADTAGIQRNYASPGTSGGGGSGGGDGGGGGCGGGGCGGCGG